MVWQSFERLNEIFEIDGPPGDWTERYVDWPTTGWGGGNRCFTPEDYEAARQCGLRSPGRRKPCEWEGVKYASIQDMATALGISRPSALYRLQRRDGTYVDKRPRKRDK